MGNLKNEFLVKGKSTHRVKLFRKDFILLVIGQIISLFGNAILRFALPLYILDQSGSAALFGVISASAFLPMIIISPIGGILADRINKQRIMVALDFFTAALILGFIILNGWVNTIILVVIMLMMLYSIQAAYNPSVQASLPLLIQKEQLISANAVVNLVTSLSSLLGPVIGGILYGTYGLSYVLIVSGSCFAFSAVLELFMRIPYIPRKDGGSIWSIVKNDMKQSSYFILKEKPIMTKVIMLVFFFNMFLSSMIIIGLPVIITQILGMSSQLYGVSQGVLASGGLIGGIAAGLFGKRLKIKYAYLLMLACSLATIPMGLALMLQMSPLASYYVIILMGAIIMINSTLFNIQMLVFVQGNTPVEIVGKVISFLMAIVTSAQPIGQAIYGMLYQQFYTEPWLVVLGTSLIASVISILSKKIFIRIN